MNEAHQIIDRIQLTEKGTLLSETLNQYVFRVAPQANKLEIKRAIEQLFGKTVLSVRTANYAGKKKRERNNPRYGRKTHWKKAIVTLKEGDKIDLA